MRVSLFSTLTNEMHQTYSQAYAFINKWNFLFLLNRLSSYYHKKIQIQLWKSNIFVLNYMKSFSLKALGVCKQMVNTFKVKIMSNKMHEATFKLVITQR